MIFWYSGQVWQTGDSGGPCLWAMPVTHFWWIQLMENYCVLVTFHVLIKKSLCLQVHSGSHSDVGMCRFLEGGKEQWLAFLLAVLHLSKLLFNCLPSHEGDRHRVSGATCFFLILSLYQYFCRPFPSSQLALMVILCFLRSFWSTSKTRTEGFFSVLFCVMKPISHHRPREPTLYAKRCTSQIFSRDFSFHSEFTTSSILPRK